MQTRSKRRNKSFLSEVSIQIAVRAASGKESAQKTRAYSPDTCAHKSKDHKIRALLVRLSPEPICDDCISKKLAITDENEVVMKTTELAGHDSFERTCKQCSMCGTRKKVIRHV